MLVLVLIVLELLWGRASLVVFAVFFNTGMPSTTVWCGRFSICRTGALWRSTPWWAVCLPPSFFRQRSVHSMILTAIPMPSPQALPACAWWWKTRASCCCLGALITLLVVGPWRYWGGTAAGGAVAGACQLACVPAAVAAPEPAGGHEAPFQVKLLQWASTRESTHTWQPQLRIRKRQRELAKKEERRKIAQRAKAAGPVTAPTMPPMAKAEN